MTEFDITEMPRDDSTSLVDLLDRLLETGVFVTGDVVITLAGIDLVQLDLRLLLTGVAEALERSTR